MSFKSLYLYVQGRKPFIFTVPLYANSYCKKLIIILSKQKMLQLQTNHLIYNKP